MSATRKPHGPGRVARIAGELFALLDPRCDAVHVAGSLRRNETSHAPKDLDVVYVPSVTRRRTDDALLDLGAEFAERERVDLVDELLSRVPVCLTTTSVIDPAADPLSAFVRGEKWGPKHKRLVYVATMPRIVIELYQARPKQLGPILAIRTGPAEFAKLLVTSRDKGGAMPNGLCQRGGYLVERATGRRIACPSEEAYFDALGVPTWEPRDRTADRLRRFLSK